MALERKLISYTTPSITIDKMEALDTTDGQDHFEKKAGSLFPLVEINKYKFTTNELVSMNIDETGFVPSCSLTVACSDGVFLSTSFPKDGDPMSVFIRSKKDEFKPLRADFTITSVMSAPSTDESGEKVMYTINGVLNVPGLYSEHCTLFKDMTAFDALTKISTELKLGFASNETTTNDKMNWICPFSSYELFVKEVTGATYKNDSDFYRSWIDHSYYLNLLNANTQFSDEPEFDDALEEFTGGTDYFNEDKIQKLNTQLILCNHPNLRGLGNYISQYTLINNSGQVVMDNGYRRYQQYYESHLKTDVPSEKYQSHYIEPTNTEGVKDKILLRGRTGLTKQDDKDKATKEYDSTNRYKWMGLQASLPDGNVHEYYSYAQIANWQNNQELDKMVLHTVLTKCNFNIYRGQRIPIIIINNGSAIRQKHTIEPKAQDMNSKMSYDKFLSGFYMVQGFRYYWTNIDMAFRQDLYLTRREWPIPSNPNVELPAGTT